MHTTLHILNKGIQNSALLTRCQHNFKAGDALLLIEDGIYWSDNHFQEQLAFAKDAVFVLAADSIARGIAPAYPLLSDDEFVTLCTQHKNSVSWF